MRTSLLVFVLHACTPSPKDTGERPEDTATGTTLEVGATRDATLGTATQRVMAFAGQVDLPLGMDNLTVSNLWGGSQPVNPDGTFVLEAPEEGTSLVLLASEDGTPLGQVLFPAHPDIVDPTIRLDAENVLTSAVWAPSVLRCTDPRWMRLGMSWAGTLPEVQAGAEALREGLTSSPDWLAGSNMSWIQVRSDATSAVQSAIVDWSAQAGLGDPFTVPATNKLSAYSGADDDVEEGQFEPIPPGSDLDGVTVSTSWTDASTVWLTEVNHEGRWVLSRVDGELAPDGILPPTTLHVPDPVALVVGLGFFYLDQMEASGQALFHGVEGPDSWQELNDWAADQVGVPEAYTFGVSLDMGDEATLTLGAYGCGLGPCPAWGDGKEQDWVPTLILTVLTEMVLPLMDYMNIEVAPTSSQGQIAQCITDLEAGYDTYGDLKDQVETALDQVAMGDSLGLSMTLEDIAWTLFRSDEIWACMGVDAFWTDEGVTQQIQDFLQAHAEDLDVTGVGQGVKTANAFISVIHGMEGLVYQSDQGAYQLLGPPLPEDCADGADNDRDGLADCDDPDCATSCIPACANGLDDDADGWTDLTDPGCASAAGSDEGGLDPSFLCNNALDDDGDGLVDAADPECATGTDSEYPSRETDCADGTDDDGDGATDCEDTDCAGKAGCPSACSNGLDDDGDGWIDTADPGCMGSPASGTESMDLIPTAGPWSCYDGTDDDGDGYADAEDPDCESGYDFEDPSLVVGAYDTVIYTSDYDASLGYSVANLGDPDGDGVPDVGLGAPWSARTGAGAGSVFVVPGDTAGSHDVYYDRTTEYYGESGSAYVGWDLAGAGDMDGDGTDDVIIGSNPNYPPGDALPGVSYLVLGPVRADLDLSAADYQIVSDADEGFGGSMVAGGMDGDGDGLPDLMIGAWGIDTVYTLHAFPSRTVDLEDSGWAVTGSDVSSFGFLGDLDGDGVAETGYGSSSDATFFVLRACPTADLDLRTSADVEIAGEGADSTLGYAFAALGDATGDGYADLALGDPGTNQAWILSGPLSDTTTLSDAVLEVRGDDASDEVGGAVGAPGDYNGDGFSDLAVGAPGDGSYGSHSGAVYLVFGGRSGTLDVSDADRAFMGAEATAGFGQPGTLVGGDLDGDGFGDLLMAAENADLPGDGTETTDGGVAWIVRGSP